MSGRPSLPHVPALDGLRGAAVVGVVLFHFVHYTGGYLGVDLFFVLSGFLITSLLLVERQERGSILLGAFWARRARRLFPAVVLLLLAVAIYAKVLADPTQLTMLRGDGLATLFYVANWRAVASNASYWAMFNDPSPLQHTWSLAIEEQFYVIWPFVAWFVLGRARRQPAGALLIVSAVGLGLSALAQLALYQPGTDPSRVYFGTDTRSAAIFMGAVLACTFHRFGRPTGRRAGLAIQGAGWTGLAILAVCWSFVDGQSAFLYRGGLLLCGLAATAVVAAATQPGGGVLAAVFSFPPLRTIGLVSYGVYLWHWPVLVVVTPERVHQDGLLLFLLRVSATGVIATASFLLVEQPIRRGALTGWAGRLSAPAGAVVVSVALVACTATPSTQATSGDTVAAALGGTGSSAEGVPGTVPPNSAAPVATIGNTPGSGGTTLGPTSSTAAPPGLTTPTTTGATPASVIASATTRLGRTPRVLLVGDSVAFSLAAGMIPVQSQLGLDIHSKAVIACGVARGTGRVKLPDGTVATEAKDCHAWPQRWADELRTFQPDLALLVIGWPGSTERDLDGVFRKPCDPVFDAWYEGEVREALDVLRSTGVPVAMTSVPYYRSAKAPPNNDANVDCLNEQYRSILDDENAEARTGNMPVRTLTTVDLAGYVCPQGRTCRTSVSDANTTALRPDGLHFDGPSGVIVGTWVVAQAMAGSGLSSGAT